MRWAYGVTTVLSRQESGLLTRTLASLGAAGFDRPRLFVDGCDHKEAHWLERHRGLEVTARNPPLRTFGNWVMTLAELYIRQPDAERYAVFQDDFVTVKGLRTYLGRWYPPKGYLNLYTFPSNQGLCPPGHTGWYRSNQLGRGAVALVFSREAVNVLLVHQHMVERPQDMHRGWRAVDGGIVTAMKKAGWIEYVHNPSLTFHTGLKSAMGNRPHPPTESFPGEEFDALTLPAKPSPPGE